jgi:hypothetical protein
MTLDKVRENRLRRLAYRLGYQIIKNASPVVGETRYMVVPTKEAFTLTLDDVEAFLMQKAAPEPAQTKPQIKPKPRRKR